MASRNKVVQSFNFEGDLRCVDVFSRPDGTYGFEEYRRDPEDRRGWFQIGHYSELRFTSASAALAEAKLHVRWLADLDPSC